MFRYVAKSSTAEICVDFCCRYAADFAYGKICHVNSPLNWLKTAQTMTAELCKPSLIITIAQKQVNHADNWQV